MTMQEGGGTSLGGISYSIGINLARFEASLAEAEQIARQRASRIGSVLSSGSSLNVPQVTTPRDAYVTQRVHVDHEVVSSEVVYPAVKPPPPVSFRQQIRIEQSQTGFAADAQQAFATASRRAASALRAEQQAAAQVGEQLATLTAAKQQATEAERSFARATRSSNRAQSGERYAGGEREEAATQAARVVLPTGALGQVRSGARRFFTEQGGGVVPGRDPLSLIIQSLARAGRSVAGGVGRFLSSESGELNIDALLGAGQEPELTAQQRRVRAQPRGPGGRFVRAGTVVGEATTTSVPPTGGTQPGTPQFAAAEVQRLMRSGLSRFEAMSQVEMETGVPRLHIAPHFEALQRTTAEQENGGQTIPRNATRLASAFSVLRRVGQSQQEAINYLSTHYSMAKGEVTALLQQANALDDSVAGAASQQQQTPAERARARAETAHAARLRRRTQTVAQDVAREEGRPFSEVRTGRVVNPVADAAARAADRAQTVAERARQRAEGGLFARTQRRAQTVAEDAAREAGRPFSVIRTGRVVEPAEEPPTQRRGIGNLGGLLPTNAAGLLRVAGAFVGIGFGINVAAGAARNLHQAVSDSLDAEIGLERATRATTATFGAQGTIAAQAASRAFTANDQTRGTQQQFLQARLGVQQATAPLGLQPDQINSVVDAAGRLARVQSTDLIPTSEAIARAMTGDTQALAAYGISLTDAGGRIRGVGLTFDQLANYTSRAHAAQVVFQTTLGQIQTQAQNTAARDDDLSTSLDRLGRAWENFKQRVGNAASGPAKVSADIATNAIGGTVPGTGLPTEEQLRQQQVQGAAAAGFDYVPETGFAIERSTRRVVSAAEIQRTIDAQLTESAARVRREVEDGSQRQSEFAASTGEATRTIVSQEDAFARLQGRAQQLNDSLSRLSQQQGQVAEVGRAARGPSFDLGVINPAQALVAARSQAAQDVLQLRAQTAATGATDTFRQNLELMRNVAREIGPNAVARAEQDIAEYDRRIAAHVTEIQATAALNLAGRAVQGAQTNLSAFTLRQQERQLDVATDMAGIRLQDLDLQGRMAPLQLEQANLQDRIRVAQRENLQLTLQRVAAEQSALPAANQLADLQFQQTEAVQEIAAFYVNRVRGVATPGVDTARVQQDIASIRENALATPQAELDVTRAQRPVQLAERAQQADQLTRQARAVSLEQEQRTLEDQLIPLDAARRLEAARTAEIERRLAIESAQEEPGRVDLQRAVDRANRVQLEADAAVRRAQAQAAGLNPDDLTGEAERRLGALPAGAVPADLPAAVNPALSSINAGQSLQIGTIAIDARGSSLSEAQIRAATEQGISTAFSRFVAGFDTNPGSAPVGVAGATP